MFNQDTKKYLVAAIRAMLRQEPAPQLPDSLNLKELYKLSKKHCVENIVYYALEQLTIEGEEELLATWQRNRDGNIIKVMNQLTELDYLSAQFESMDVKHLPLKGPLLIDLYPQIDFRYLGDLDILVEEADLQKVADFIHAQGYVPIDEDYALHHQEYRKKLGAFALDLEIHSDLVGANTVYYKLYQKPWQKLSLEKVTDYRYQMNMDDFYLFLLVHLAKHYYNSGTGIRSLMDIYVYLNAYRQELNFSYIDEQLEKVELKNFRQEVEDLTEAWFGEGEFSISLEQMAENFLNHGAYGDLNSLVDNRLNQSFKDGKGSKVSYALHRFFLPRLTMEGIYPILKKHPYLLPYFWCHRIISAILHPSKRHRMAEELSRLKQVK